jgi:CheY-like chemotaxis protein
MAVPKILIVEDEYIIANDIETILQDMGYEVCALVSSGEQAIEKTEKLRPDVVLMDIMLKGKMDGIETANHIKLNYNIPIIYITAYADDKILEKAMITEPFGYLIKPFKDQELRLNIEMALYKHSIEIEKENLIIELRTALDKLKTLSGLLPICSKCKKIRNDKGYWEQIETYISHHSEAEFTHGMCHECMEESYAKQDWYRKMKSKKNTQ